MGYELYREVKAWAPPTLTHREKLTAMVLADDANDQTRVTWSSVVDPEIMRQSMVADDRAMRRIVARLKDEKVIEHAGGGHNGKTAKYRFLHLAPASVPASEKPGDSDPATAVVGSPEETGYAGAGPTKPGQKDPATTSVAGPESPGYGSDAGSQPGEKDPPTTGVAGSFRASSRVKNTLPTPAPPTTSPSKTAARKRTAAAEKHAVADRLTAAFWEHHGTGRAQSFLAVRGVIRTCLQNGIERDDLARALDQLAREGRPISGGTVQVALQPAQAASGRQPFTNPTNHDVYDGEIQ